MAAAAAAATPLPSSPNPQVQTSSTPSQSHPTPGSNRLYDIPSLENDAANFQTWKFRIQTVLDIRGLWSIVDGTKLCPASTQLERRTSKRSLACDDIKGGLIGELFRSTFSDDSPLEPQLNAMRHKAHVLSSLGLKLEDTLIAIAMVISLPESYSTLRTILMSTEDSLSPDSVIAQVLIEEKSRRNPSQTALLV